MNQVVLVVGMFTMLATTVAVPPLSAQTCGTAPRVLYKLPDSQPCLKGRSNCAIYPKAAQLPSGRLVASFELATVPSSGTAAGETLPVYKSDDNGRTWEKLSVVRAPAYLSKGPQYAKYTSAWTNPYLYVLPRNVGRLKAGTLLMAAVVSGDDYYYRQQKAANPDWVPSSDGDRRNMAIALYSGTDQGADWNLVNIIAKGGWQGGSAGAIGLNVAAANSYREVDPVWEPYLMVYRNQLVAYYSDENDYLGYNKKTGAAIIDPSNSTATDSDGQILVHRTWNGISANWSNPVVDVPGLTETLADGKQEIGEGRPGMANVVQTTDGKWMMTFEFWGGGANVRYKLSDDPLRFWAVDGSTGKPITALPVSSGSSPLSQGSSPVLVRLPDGRLLYNAGGSGAIWLNRSGSSSGTWTEYQTTMPAGYSRNLTYDSNTGRVVILGNKGLSTIIYGDIQLGCSRLMR